MHDKTLALLRAVKAAHDEGSAEEAWWRCADDVADWMEAGCPDLDSHPHPLGLTPLLANAVGAWTTEALEMASKPTSGEE